MISSILLFIDSVVQSINLGSKMHSVFSTLSENCSKVLCAICLLGASGSSFADTMLNMFSIGLRSGEHDRILSKGHQHPVMLSGL